MAKFLFILNGPPYGDERSYNGLRLADSLAKNEGHEVRVFLIGDATACAKRGQNTPQGFYNLERMLQLLLKRKGQVGVCGSCLEARGMTATELVEGCHRSSMEELTNWTTWADKVLAF